MINLKNNTVLVPGGFGFVGTSVCNVLRKRGAVVIPVKKSHYNLIDPDDTSDLFNDMRLDYVINLAANTGGIVYNKKCPADLFRDNVLISTNVLNECRKHNVKKIINITTSCSYGDGETLLKEENYWDGRPNSSVEFFAIAKKASESYCRSLHRQYGMCAPTLCITNLYGENDRFDENGKVTSNLIRKFVQAKEENLPFVECLGTGNPKRELLYISDAAEAIVRSLEVYNDCSIPLNIGYGSDISIKELAELIAKIVGYTGEIKFGGGQDGQLVKLLDSSRMRKILDYEPPTSLEVGLRQTIQWYMLEHGY